MPASGWVPKAGTPPVFDLGIEFGRIVNADGSSLGWLALLDPVLAIGIYVTSDFCSNGPYEAPTTTLDDWTVNVGDPLDTGNQLKRGQLETAIAKSQVFGLLCELPGIGTEIHWGTETCYTLDSPPGQATVDQTYYATHLAVPQPWDHIRTRITAGAATLHMRGWAGGTVTPNYGTGGEYAMGAFYANTLNEQSVAGGTMDSMQLWVENSNTVETVLTVCITLGRVGPVTTPFVPEPQPEPPGLPVHDAGLYPDLAAVGRELDRQEVKLDNLTALLRYLVTNAVPAATGITAGATVPATGTLMLPPHCVGLVVALTGQPAGSDLAFGHPPRLHRLGRLNLGTATGWAPAVDLSQTPLLVTPIPAGIDRVGFTVYPPTTATCTYLVLQPLD